MQKKMNEVLIKYPRNYLNILNQIFEIETKLRKISEPNSIQRNIDKLKNIFSTEALSEGQSLFYHNPIGENYNETRTDCDATITGSGHDNLRIVEVIKPIIYVKYGQSQMIVQKAIVIVESKQ